MMIVLGLAISAPIVMMLLHLLLQRTVYSGGEPKARLKLVIRIVAGVTLAWGILSALVLSRLPWPLLWLNTAYVLVVSFGLGMCYFNVFALSETALRIRLLLESYVAEKQGRSDRPSETLKNYNAESLIRVRIDRLLAMGAAREQNGKIVAVSLPLIWTSKLIHFVGLSFRRVLFGHAGEDRTPDAWKDL